MNPEYETIEVSRERNVATIALNRPKVHNAMNDRLMGELRKCFENLSFDDGIRSVILTGKGKSFCGGADLNWMKSTIDCSKEENIENSRTLLNLFETIYRCPKFVIGRINGHTFGGGLGLIAVCDINIAVEGSKFAFSETKLGLIPAVISTYVIRRIGPARARHLFATGERFDSEYAKDIGLVDLVVAREELDSTIQKHVDEIKSSGPLAVKEAKNLIRVNQEMEAAAYKEFTVQKIAELRVSEEGREGMNAFFEKRKPRWLNVQ